MASDAAQFSVSYTIGSVAAVAEEFTVAVACELDTQYWCGQMKVIGGWPESLKAAANDICLPVETNVIQYGQLNFNQFSIALVFDDKTCDLQHFRWLQIEKKKCCLRLMDNANSISQISARRVCCFSQGQITQDRGDYFVFDMENLYGHVV